MLPASAAELVQQKIAEIITGDWQQSCPGMRGAGQETRRLQTSERESSGLRFRGSGDTGVLIRGNEKEGAAYAERQRVRQ
eukprot:2724744-Rhodomonas_salina.2